MSWNGYEIETLIIIVLLFQAIFSIVYLSITNWTKHRWIIFAITVLLVHFIGVLSIKHRLFTHPIIFLNPSIILLLPVGIFLYVKQTLRETVGSWYQLAGHFIPFLFFYVLMISSAASMGAGIPHGAEGIVPPGPPPHMRAGNGIQPPPLPGGPLRMIFGISTLIIYFGYLFALIHLIMLKLKTIPEQLSTKSWEQDKRWLIGVVVVFAFSILMILLAHQGRRGIVGVPGWFAPLGFLLIICALSYFAFRQPALEEEEGTRTRKRSKGIEPKIAFQRMLDAERSISRVEIISSEFSNTSLKAQLELLMKEKQPYLIPKLRLPDLAELLGIHPHSLSKFINEEYQLNFFHFINQYRVLHAAELLKNEETANLTIEAIGLESGFNSKTTFNTRFKELIGESPGVYQRKFKSKF